MKGDKWCENCKWWGGERAHQDDTPYGTCRATLPQLGEAQALPYHDPQRPGVAGPIVRRGAWPWTAFDDWCGCFYADPVPATPNE
jgi:hypothetical protein